MAAVVVVVMAVIVVDRCDSRRCDCARPSRRPRPRPAWRRSPGRPFVAVAVVPRWLSVLRPL